VPQPVNKANPNLWIYLCLFAVTLLVYFQVSRFSFINFDDPVYVSRNPHVQSGLTAAGVLWAFTSTEGANWFPVTRLSHLLDAQLFGLDSGWHHLSSVLIHAAASLMLFAFLFRATRARWQSAFVAAIFALHPLHVESVAWVSERKDVLCAFFWFLTLWAWVRYTEAASAGRYVLALASFCLGLMSKPMIVTLPFLLLLLDRWPLRRPGLRIREKLPFFALSAASAAVTWWAQQAGGAVRTAETFPLPLRFENALVSFAVYIGQMLGPGGLAVFYPYPAAIPLWEWASAALFLAALIALAFRFGKSRPWLAVGVLWFLITLLPVIGLVQVGAQARADRYMYVPMVGLLIAVAWGGAELIQSRRILVRAGVAICLVSAAMTAQQASYWRDSEALFTHAVAVNQGNYLAWHNLGDALMEKPGRLREAITDLEISLKIRPDSVSTHTDLGNALTKVPGRLPDAIAQYQEALRLDPSSPIPHEDLASALAETPGRLPEAVDEYRKTLALAPDTEGAHEQLGQALLKLGRAREAIPEFNAALQQNPGDTVARSNLAAALAADPARAAEAVGQYRAVLQNEPGSAETHYNLGLSLAKAGNAAQAISEFEAALRLRPDYAEAHNNLGVTLTAIPNRAHEAISHFDAAVKSKPDYAEAHFNLGVAYANTPGKLPQAIAQFEEANRLRPDPQIQDILKRLRRGGA
jgi:tetratricopeptide (TPR) repeat protein